MIINDKRDDLIRKKIMKKLLKYMKTNEGCVGFLNPNIVGEEIETACSCTGDDVFACEPDGPYFDCIGAYEKDCAKCEFLKEDCRYDGCLMPKANP